MLKKILTRHWPVILYLSIFFVVIGVQIIFRPTPFYDWDESIYAQVGREMIRARSLIPLWQGQFWLDKPPLAPLFYRLFQIISLNPGSHIFGLTAGSECPDCKNKENNRTNNKFYSVPANDSKNVHFQTN